MVLALHPQFNAARALQMLLDVQIPIAWRFLLCVSNAAVRLHDVIINNERHHKEVLFISLQLHNEFHACVNKLTCRAVLQLLC